jgi:membrane protein
MNFAVWQIQRIMSKKKTNIVVSVTQFLTHDLWHIDVKTLPKPKAMLYHVIKIGSVAYDEWTRGRLVYRASALTYFTLLAIVPVFALFFGIAKGFGLDAFLSRWMQRNLAWAGDALPTILNFINSLLTNTKSGIIVGVGVLFLLYSVIQMLGHIENALNDIRHIDKQRTWTRKFTDYLAIMIIAPIFLIVSSSAMYYVMHTLRTVTGDVGIPHSGRFFFSLIPYLMSIILFASLYIIMPNTRVKLKPVIIASIIAGVGFQLWQLIYIKFQIGVTRYNAVYGSFAALPLLLIYLYYMWIIFLLGANIAYAIENIKRIEIERRVVTLSIRKMKVTYTFLIYTVVKNFERNEAPTQVSSLAKIVKLPERVIQGFLQNFVTAGLVREVELDEDDETGYVPAFDINRMTLGMLLDVIENKINHSSAVHETELMEHIARLYEEHDMNFIKTEVLIKDLKK